MEPSRKALAFIGEARSLAALSELEARFAELIATFGYSSATCVLMAEPSKPITPRVLFGLGDMAAREVYLKRQDFRHDPTFQAVFSHSRAFTWSEIEPRATTPRSRDLFSTARASGRRGLVVPLHGHFGEVASVVLTGAEVDCDAQARHTLQTCAAIFASHGRQLLDLETDRATPSGLSRRETQVLVWLSRGKSLPEVALILGISIGTSKTHLDRAKAKLGEPLTVPAVLEAGRRGYLIDPEDFD